MFTLAIGRPHFSPVKICAHIITAMDDIMRPFVNHAYIWRPTTLLFRSGWLGRGAAPSIRILPLIMTVYAPFSGLCTHPADSACAPALGCQSDASQRPLHCRVDPRGALAARRRNGLPRPLNSQRLPPWRETSARRTLSDSDIPSLRRPPLLLSDQQENDEFAAVAVGQALNRQHVRSVDPDRAVGRRFMQRGLSPCDRMRTKNLAVSPTMTGPVFNFVPNLIPGATAAALTSTEGAIATRGLSPLIRRARRSRRAPRSATRARRRNTKRKWRRARRDRRRRIRSRAASRRSRRAKDRCRTIRSI